MLYKLFILLFLCSSAFADPAFFVYQEEGKVKVLSSVCLSKDSVNKFPVVTLPKHWDWEGMGSHLDFSIEKDVLVFKWELDESGGPYWVEVELRVSNDSVSVWKRRKRSGVPPLPTEVYEARIYTSYKELTESKDELAGMVAVLLHNSKISIPDMSEIKTAFGIVPDNKEIENEIRGIVAKLDDEDWHVRLKAEKELCNVKYLAYIDKSIANVQLTPEQDVRISCVKEWTPPNQILVNYSVMEKLCDLIGEYEPTSIIQVIKD